MLGTRDELVGRAVVASLNRLDARGREHRVQIRILTGAFGDPAPARLVRDVDHRGVGLLEPDDGRLARAVRVVVERNLRIEELAGASGIGKTVRNPWMVSKAKRIGIFSRDSSTARRCSL